MKRYSRDQILAGLRSIVRSDGVPLPNDGEPIHEHMRRTDFLSDFGFYELRAECERTFGVPIGEADWKDFFGLALCRSDTGEWLRSVAPRLTYERLADWLAERVAAVSFDAVEIAGVRCERAGAFLGVRELVRQLNPDASRFAPSTPIRHHLTRADLFALWRRLTWLSRDTLPDLRNRWVNRAQVFVFCSALGAIGGLIAAVACGIAALAFHALSAVKLSWAVLRLAERCENPLPDDIVTFGDLARRLAEAREAAATG